MLHLKQLQPKQLQGPHQLTMMLKKHSIMKEAMMRMLGLATLEKMKASNKWQQNKTVLQLGCMMLAVTGFYPKLKSFWSCSHMKCCQHYMLYINLHILYILFIKLNFDLKEFQVPNNYFKSYQKTR